ncbi:hypothetical protein GALL_210840 [mine drainage metagenome]|uniref:Zinc finger/thioredoxin putative domain-containing protein n=1 Tax=mine drainage metagenome TaxID=410659 RepID=A0A1J5RY40_9ZZZZ
MRSITHCPSCQTQFFVTEEQLNKHHGQVRCGQCLHVFDAREQFIDEEHDYTDTASSTSDQTENIKPTTSSTVTTDVNVNNAKDNISDEIQTEDQPYNPDNPPEITKKRRINQISIKARNILTLLFASTLLLAAIAQSIYFLRNTIAIYYPASKAYLTQACQSLGCRIDLPKKIEFIVIDDSDMQEDKVYAGLMHLSSTIINQAAFNQAYPNVEITLTDTEDKPKLRRTFTPNEYLSEHTDITKGITAGENIKIQLAITTAGIAVAGYRVFVTY